MSEKFGTDWKENGAIRMAGFIEVMSELNRPKAEVKDGRDNFR
jgi:hypothetical protein